MKQPSVTIPLLLGALAVACGACTTAPPRNRVYVTNESSGDLSVIDADTQMVVATAPLGKRPRGIRVSGDQKRLYVALSGSPNAGPGMDVKSLPPPDRSADGIGEIDADTYKIIRIIQRATTLNHSTSAATGPASTYPTRTPRS
jgi:YVTN family beta-propeller protein